MQCEYMAALFNLSTANMECNWSYSLLNQAAIIETNSPPAGSQVLAGLSEVLWYTTKIVAAGLREKKCLLFY